MDQDEKAYYLECKDTVTTALAPIRVVTAWPQAREFIGEGLITKLQSADMALRRYRNEQMLIQSDLQDLRLGIASALEALKDSALPSELQSFISMNLVRIRTALDEYEYRGMAGLQDALSGYLGSLAVASEKIVEHTTQPQKKSLGDVLVLVNNAMNLAHSAAIAYPHLHTGLTMLAGLLNG